MSSLRPTWRSVRIAIAILALVTLGLEPARRLLGWKLPFGPISVAAGLLIAGWYSPLLAFSPSLHLSTRQRWVALLSGELIALAFAFSDVAIHWGFKCAFFFVGIAGLIYTWLKETKAKADEKSTNLKKV